MGDISERAREIPIRYSKSYTRELFSEKREVKLQIVCDENGAPAVKRADLRDVFCDTGPHLCERGGVLHHGVGDSMNSCGGSWHYCVGRMDEGGESIDGGGRGCDGKLHETYFNKRVLGGAQPCCFGIPDDDRTCANAERGFGRGAWCCDA